MPEAGARGPDGRVPDVAAGGAAATPDGSASVSSSDPGKGASSAPPIAGNAAAGSAAAGNAAAGGAAAGVSVSALKASLSFIVTSKWRGYYGGYDQLKLRNGQSHCILL